MFFKSMVAGMAVAVIAAGSAFAAECTLSADATDGKTISNQCKTCHVFEADKPSRPTGPNLHDIFDDKAGTRKDFPKYSEAITAANAKGLVWTEDKLFAYLADPKAFFTAYNGAELKHGMFFSLKDDAKRKDVIAFLKAIKGKSECN
ncbi:MAG TPA: cytochrome c family protein [Patescibacteria group bacterium]|nr:cytochrome c family protein [Patescibacteria group bacterium]